MSHKHENLLRTIFQDPISANIHWREIESLLHHLAAEIERPIRTSLPERLGQSTRRPILHDRIVDERRALEPIDDSERSVLGC